MNFLAHAYLSFHQPALLTGNMMGDFVKGRQMALYPASVQRGIALHRAIDTFTDTHPSTMTAKDIFRPQTRLYGAVFVDIIYDHFLANDPLHFTDASLQSFAQQVYHTLHIQDFALPPDFTRMIQYMSSENWLYGYKSKEGIAQSFRGMVRRAKYIDFTASVPLSVFETNYAALQQCYNDFFPELLTFAKDYIAA
ncbi:Acyl carrier protein phosphodiesterase [Chitinophaga costaii]|uniref:Acyl carrier protein phosphodiesterase n=1 Tax=Chitinophaga costaii TaxID=1335309 RepID=A0A1C4B2Z6_9BACT|nr:ACP phosphodiesterase [Chitinophaga costaii]PUZ26846.1 DUF479 domain-containing protein [Chitinophaga costaii]SCC01240.1 Acyl carrier protein phosphodiesterase [Chitinophaga costaii]